jgi:hypothetical protein
MRRTEDTIRQREVVSRTAQKRAPITAHGSSGCYIDLKIGGTIFSAAWICFIDFGFLPWVPEAAKGF